MPHDSNCPFCKIASRERGDFTYVQDSDIIFEALHFTAFLGLSRYPNNPCKILLIPNEHFTTFKDMPLEFSYEYNKAVQKLSAAIELATQSTGTFIWFQNGLAIQDIPHFHTHILPRFPNDNFLHGIQHPQKIGLHERAVWVDKIKLCISK